MIQVLTYSGTEQELQGNGIKLNRIHDAESLDYFEINIICLQNEYIWYSKGNDTVSINSINDLKSLAIMINNSTRSNIIILFPQNQRFKYNTWRSNSREWDERELKNMIPNLRLILSVLFEPIKNINVVYENTKTKVGENTILSAFYFSNNVGDVITKSEKSGKPTTIRLNSIILSTLKLTNYDEINRFLKMIGFISDRQELPKWIQEVKMFDDEKQLETIQENEQLISEHQQSINDAKQVLNKNQRYKTILYTNGDELVDVVFEIFKKMLGCDLSKFEDEKKEDFNFEIGEKIFIGEIKGVTPNVKKANVSQLDVHVQEYLDEHEEEQERLVSLLIINHQRNKPLNERENIPEEQIRLAERNRSLIVETITLLRLFEKYTSGEKTREECIDLLKNNVGLLQI